MKRQIMLAALSLATLGAAPLAQAKGCLKGAAVGGAAGHVAGHHGLLGAIAGCAVGHHRAKKQQQHSVQPTQQHKG
jgi:outer membrane lipoprotein SlyB